MLGYGLQCLLNLAALSRNVQIRMSWREMMLPVAGSAGMLAVIRGVSSFQMEYNIILLLAMGVGGCLYLLFLLITGQISDLTGRKKEY